MSQGINAALTNSKFSPKLYSAILGVGGSIMNQETGSSVLDHLKNQTSDGYLIFTDAAEMVGPIFDPNALDQILFEIGYEFIDTFQVSRPGAMLWMTRDLENRSDNIRYHFFAEFEFEAIPELRQTSVKTRIDFFKQKTNSVYEVVCLLLKHGYKVVVPLCSGCLIEDWFELSGDYVIPKCRKLVCPKTSN